MPQRQEDNETNKHRIDYVKSEKLKIISKLTKQKQETANRYKLKLLR